MPRISIRTPSWTDVAYKQHAVVRYLNRLWVAASDIPASSGAPPSAGKWVPMGDAYSSWQGEWANTQYYKNDIVRDGTWTMIANKDTLDRAAPQPVGDAGYVYDGTSPTQGITAKYLEIGQRYTYAQAGYLTGVRVYTISGNVYRVFFISDPLGTPGFRELVSQFTADLTGWTVFPLGTIAVPSNTTFDIVAAIDEPGSTPGTWTANYNYTNPQNPGVPVDGVAEQARSELGTIRISKLDADANNNGTALLAMTPGEVIELQGVRWSIQTTPSDQGTYVGFAIAPATLAPLTGLWEFTFEVSLATPITTVVDPNYWVGNDDIEGFYVIDGGTEFFTESQYGVDIELQEASISPDWDIMATSTEAVGGGGGSGGGIPEAPQDGTLYGRKDAVWAGAAEASHAHPDTVPSGGTTGQHLAKKTDGPYDTEWVDAGEGGASDHGALTGLADDDHTQYHTDARGDARYDALGAAGTVQTNLDTHEARVDNPHTVTAAQAGAAPTAHQHTLVDVTDSGTMAAEDDAVSDGNEYVRRDAGWVQNTGGSLPDGAMIWKGIWQAGTYEKDWVVRNGDWTMIANKQTTDEPVPPGGVPGWYTDLGDSPGWWNVSGTSRIQIVGHRHTMQSDFQGIKGRVWAEVSSSGSPDIYYQAYLMIDPLGVANAVQITGGWVQFATANQWYEYVIDTGAQLSGTVVDAVLMIDDRSGGDNPQWVEDIDYFSGDPNNTGIWQIGSYNAPTVSFTNHAYGIDMQLQSIVPPSDWDIVAYSG